MFKTLEKLEQRIKELDAYRYRDAINIEGFSFLEDENGEVGTRPPESGSWGKINLGDSWKGWDRYIWLRTSIRFPKEWKDRSVVGKFDFGKTGGGHNSGFESLLYVNGEVYQGVDSNHKEVFFSEDAAGEELDLCFRLWSGLDGMGGSHEEQEHKIRQAQLSWLDQCTDDLFYTAKAVFESINVMNENNATRMQLVKILDRAFKTIDWTNPASDMFYQSIESAIDILNTELEKIETKDIVTVRGIGHTHIDVAWLWRLRHTREKTARSFSTVLRLMEKYPDYIFLQTQPQLYEYIKNDYPEIYADIKNRVKEGRWEVGGVMWLEPDNNIPSGESLVRQILKGQAFFDKEFGNSSFKYLWLPDVFGYSWALPQILKKSGIEVFMTTKISWNQFNRMPHDTFHWRGIDGSEILTHFITTPEENSSKYTYNGLINAESVKGIWDEYKDKPLNQELIIAYGYGDGGGGVNRDMLEMRRRLNRVPGMPNVTTGRADDYFSDLKNRVENSDQYVHTWDGELYLEYHRGTYTSQAHNKRMNRKMELAYRETEWLSVFGYLFSGQWDQRSQENFDEGWKIILRNQFHDILPGSSISEVYKDSKEEYEKANILVTQSRNKQEDIILSEIKDNAFVVFNSSPWKQSNIVNIEGVKLNTGSWKDHNDNKLEAQNKNGTWYVHVNDIPSLGYTTIYFDESPAQDETNTHSFETSRNGIVTPFYKIEWNDKGQLTNIYDIENKRHALKESPGNVMQVFEDKPLDFDAWDIDLFYQEKFKVIQQLENISVIELGSVRAVISFKWSYHNSLIDQEMVLYANSRRIDFNTKVDWHENNQLLKVKFPVNVRATEATYDIQYGNVKRPTHWNTSWDYARFESVGHQWADISERNYGVSLLNDCKYGYDIKDNVIRLSLIKSAVKPDPEQDQGSHVFTYSLYPHNGDWFEGGTVKEAWYLNNPLSFSQGKAKKEKDSLFFVSSENIMIDAIKKAEQNDEIIVRLHEYAGKRNDFELMSDYEIVEWIECDLMENPIQTKMNSNTINSSVLPYEIKTFKINMKDI
ncbi:alpha-mannosidase [Lentibacillus amyloliquefaciens]|uniref:Alpha-mannosidase n=1 Tax=Lentibacillus amyloliquefaciens TaxID=1472767 RepID=A0A0U4FN95_9BACI|nr:alpha-mannosidase [Lentibacillus amyloliquefaciens]ALX50126.1 alpha-mannosidase [Lentibacillus amyloliquefaciens]